MPTTKSRSPNAGTALAAHVERGPLLLPVPANGRGPEIALELMRHGVDDIFVDEAMRKALQRLGDGDAASLRAVPATTSQRLAAIAKPIDGARGVMLAGSADGTSGATARLIPQFETFARGDDPVHRLRQPDHAGGAADQKRPRADHALERASAALRHGRAGASDRRRTTVIPAFCDRAKLAALAAALAPARVTMDETVEI